MNKRNLVYAVAKRAGWTTRVAEYNVSIVLDEVARALVDGKNVTLTGFGTFNVVDRAERRSRNPKTGEPVTVPARKSITFRPGVRLLAYLRGEKDPAGVARVYGKRGKFAKED